MLSKSKYTLLDRKDDDLLTHLLKVRGIKEEDKITFLNPDYENGRHDPFLLNDMSVAVDRLLSAIKANQKIAIYSDYDCDGIPGAVVAHDFFRAIGYENFINYIPHRHYEGFGLSAAAATKLADDKVDLIITIDCGTSDVEASKQAAALGIDLIITDHHEPKDKLPVAVAVVNPRIGDSYPFPHLCGAAVIFKLIEATISRGNFAIKPGYEKWWLDMVGIATIGDMVPLIGENRIFAHYGLQVLRKSRRPGLQHLLRKARADQRYLTADDVGFTIAPRINAASRMDSPEDAFLMLTEKEESSAIARATYLEQLNNERKGIVAAMTKELRRRISELIDLPAIIVMGNPNWRPALVGLCANSLAEEHNRPVFLWGRDGNGVIKGSCRSGSSVSVVKLMEGAQKHFLEHGGHHASGGFAVKEESVFNLGQALNDAYVTLGDQVFASEEVVVDAVLSLDDINKDLLNTLKALAPYGTGNDKPLFAFKDVVPTEVVNFGKSQEHLKLILAGTNKKIEAIAFFAKAEQYSVSPTVAKPLTLLAHLEESFFMNRLQTRLRIVDIVNSI